MTTKKRIEYVIREATGVYWPGCLPYRSRATARGRGYRTEDEAYARAERVNAHYNATQGCGLDLRVEAREAEPVTYTCSGPVCGSCDHRHRTISGAAACLDRHHGGCASQGGYSDREIVRSDGQWMSWDEDYGGYLDEDDVEYLREQEWER